MSCDRAQVQIFFFLNWGKVNGKRGEISLQGPEEQKKETDGERRGWGGVAFKRERRCAQEVPLVAPAGDTCLRVRPEQMLEY